MKDIYEEGFYGNLLDDFYEPSKKKKKDKKGGKKKSKKKNESDKEIIEMLGGKEKVKELGAAMVEYAETYKRFIILDGCHPDDFSKQVEECIKMLHDLEKGKTYMLDYDAVCEYYQTLRGE